MPIFKIIQNNGRTINFSIDRDKITIGRSKDNDIPLFDNTVSRNHARIEKNEEGYSLTDLGSFNGTLVNEVPTQSILLNHNDTITKNILQILK